jgi:cell division septal protein FtsQ
LKANAGSTFIGKFFIAAFIFFILYFVVSKIFNSLSSADAVLIKNIEIISTENITKAEIKAALPFKEGDSLITADLSRAEKEIAKSKPEFQSISISRGWKKVSVKVQERKPEAFVKNANSIMAIDSSGVVFPLRGFMSAANVPTISYKNDNEQKEILNFIHLLKAADKSFLDGVSNIQFTNSKGFVLITDENAVIHWGNADYGRLKNKIDAFKKAFVSAKSNNEKIDYVDMTFYDNGRIIINHKK